MKRLAQAGAVGLIGVAAMEVGSRVLWGRSVVASFFEVGIRLSGMRMNEDECRERLNRISSQPEHPRTPPLPFFYPTETITVADTPVHVLNPDSTSNAVVLYLHGGGFAHSLSAAHIFFLNALARRSGATIVVPLYPLAPHHDWHDAVAVIRTVWQRLLKDRPGARTVVMGDSAGGTLALVHALDLAERSLPQPDELILISPLVDATFTDPRIKDLAPIDPMINLAGIKIYVEAWSGSTPLQDWHLSPINANLTALTKVTTYAGTREILLPDAERLHDRLTTLGVDSTLRIGRGLNHVYPLIPSPEGIAAGREIARLVRGD